MTDTGLCGTDVSGPELFARYAYPPNERGYCGPGEPGVLLEAAAEGGQLLLLSHLARQFDGAWPYLELIAGCNGVGRSARSTRGRGLLDW